MFSAIVPPKSQASGRNSVVIQIKSVAPRPRLQESAKAHVGCWPRRKARHYQKGKTDVSEPLTATPLPLDAAIESTSPAEADRQTASPLGNVQGQPAPIFITEQEVLFSTAAAVLAPSTRWWTRVTHAVAVAKHRVFTASSDDSQPKRRAYPPRLAFLEDSRMAREMHRL
jgi:hypothetical protein